MKTFKNIAKKNKRYVILLFLTSILFFTFFFLLPKARLGLFFFGGNKYAYSLPLSHFFYQKSIRFDSKKGIPPEYSYYQLGRIAFIRGNFDEALTYFEKEYSYYPTHHKTLYMKGLTLAYMDKSHAAIDAFEEYNQKVPTGWAGKNDEAWLLYKVGNLKQAKEVIEKAYQDGARNPWVYNTYGVILLNEENCLASKTVLSEAYTMSLTLTNEGWGSAYPGNNPKIYREGLEAMRDSIEKNLQKAEICLKTVEKH